MGFTAAQVAPEEVKNGEIAKNVSLLSIITLTCGFGKIRTGKDGKSKTSGAACGRRKTYWGA